MSDTLTPQVASKVLLADVANILQKAKSGKPLTKYERGIIESAADKPEPTTPKTEAKGKPTKGRKSFTWSLHFAAAEFGVSRDTIRRGLAMTGVQKPGDYTTGEICNAIYGDLKKARAREATANAIAKERDNRVADMELIPTAEVLKMIHDAMMPIRQRLIALPSEMANRCNPVDSKLARDALQRWTDSALATIRAELPQPKAK